MVPYKNCKTHKEKLNGKRYFLKFCDIISYHSVMNIWNQLKYSCIQDWKKIFHRKHNYTIRDNNIMKAEKNLKNEHTECVSD